MPAGLRGSTVKVPSRRCPSAQVVQAAAAVGRAEPDAVVADVDGQPVGRRSHVDLGGRRPRVPGDVGERLADHGEQVLADVVADRVDQAGEPDRGFEAEAGVDRSPRPAGAPAAPAPGSRKLLELEDLVRIWRIVASRSSIVAEDRSAARPARGPATLCSEARPRRVAGSRGRAGRRRCGRDRRASTARCCSARASASSSASAAWLAKLAAMSTSSAVNAGRPRRRAAHSTPCILPGRAAEPPAPARGRMPARGRASAASRSSRSGRPGGEDLSGQRTARSADACRPGVRGGADGDLDAQLVRVRPGSTTVTRSASAISPAGPGDELQRVAGVLRLGRQQPPGDRRRWLAATRRGSVADS